ncbi:MAG: pyridoxine 5'-phosphate synthase [Candidatus Omnitrophica bacterium]|nr:pyridoxine 5'-phosphate synthase [Candidatus Omnitrophota bacterium]
MPLLGVNIDHIATLRQARREFDPDPVKAALVCQDAGADSIVAHLREDRRHINDDDVKRLRRALRIRFNLEMSINPGIVAVACRLKPDQVTLVPERREELTTEGGLDVKKGFNKLKACCRKLADKGIDISLFIAPDKVQIEKTKDLGVPIVEFHTGSYAQARTAFSRQQELKRLMGMAAYATKLGLTVNAGHGLKYHNTLPVALIRGMNELNIGHSIISRAAFVGLKQAVREMITIIKARS